MEEILASIRRIITEDEPAKQSPPTEAISPDPLRAAAPPAMPATPSRFTPGPATDSSALRDEEIDAKLAELRGMSRHASPASAGDAPPERSSPSDSSPALQRPASEERDLLSPATAAAIEAAFNTLAQTTHPRGGRTVEELVSELIRPMLKTWLDDNLPAIVERLVRAEIERLSRGRE